MANPTNPSASDTANANKIKNPEILGEPANGPKTDYASKGFIGSDTAGGAFVGYRNPRRQKKESGGSGAGSAEFAAQDPRRLDLNKGPVRDLADVPAGAEQKEEKGVTEVKVNPIN
jgi:hypothetical protein